MDLTRPWELTCHKPGWSLATGTERGWPKDAELQKSRRSSHRDSEPNMAAWQRIYTENSARTGNRKKSRPCKCHKPESYLQRRSNTPSAIGIQDHNETSDMEAWCEAKILLLMRHRSRPHLLSGRALLVLTIALDAYRAWFAITACCTRQRSSRAPDLASTHPLGTVRSGAFYVCIYVYMYIHGYSCAYFFTLLTYV